MRASLMARPNLTFTVLIAVLVSTPHACPQCVPRTHAVESFSSIATVGGLAYPSGMELILSEHGSRVDAILRDYVGEERAEETKLRGTIEEKKAGGVTSCEVQLAGTGKRGVVKVRGVITNIGFQGTVERHIGPDAFSHRISLKRRLPDETDRATG
jgi:hypothetical protein